MTGTRLIVGKTNVRTTGYPSEPTFVAQVNAAMKKVAADMNYICQQFEDVTPEILLDIMQPIYDESQVLVPVDTGALKDSGYIEIRQFKGNPTVEIGYGKGGNPWYTVYVHEMPLPHKPPTQYKFLEQPANAHLGQMIDDLATRYKEFMGS